MPHLYALTPLDETLHLICEGLQLSKTQRDIAEQRYKGVTKYLSRPGGIFENTGVDIYSQGSLRIGTTIKPLGREDFDLDVVCHIDLASDETENPKELIGELYRELYKNENYRELLEPKARCIRLNYADEFHMDILLGCQDNTRCHDCIKVPDREANKWSPSNPNGYAKWFLMAAEESKLFLLEKKATMDVRADISPIPPADSPFAPVPLKRVVQLMKRHRDLYFEKNPEIKPISVVLTTLAGDLYTGRISVADSMLELLQVILKTVQDEESKGKRLVVWNPTNNLEDFSEKWDKYPERYEAFKGWARTLRDEMVNLITKAKTYGVYAAEKDLQRLFGGGGRVVSGALTEIQKIHPDENRPTTTHSEVIFPIISSKFQWLFGRAPHRLPPETRWDMSPTHLVNIACSFTANNSTVSIPYESNGPALPKHGSLKFTAFTNMPEPFSVFWQVVNTGHEASYKEELRGGFYSDGLTREESTAYKGQHWVQCYVVKGSRCFAMSEPFLVNIA